MYAIIRAGGKQSKVHEGDVLSIERIKETENVSFTPLLIVADDGSIVSDPAKLKTATVTAEVVGDSHGPKLDIFKYKNKTGYRRRMGHRQKYTTIKVIKIQETATEAKSATVEKATKKPAAKKTTAAEKTAAETTAATKKATKPADNAGDKEA